MKIYRLSNLLYIPFIAIGVFIYFYLAEFNRDYSIWIIAPAICIALIYVFKSEIDNWWLDRNPPILTQKMKDWLIQFSTYYNQLSSDKQLIFEQEMSIFIETNQYYIVGKEAEPVPYDIKGIVAHEAIKLIVELGTNPFDNINRIVLYKHAFPSPVYKYLHTVETHKEDGVIIFSLEHLIPGLLSPHSYYNTAMHGFLEMAEIKTLENYLNSETDVTWESLKDIAGFSEEFIRATLGLKEINKTTILVNYYLNHVKKTKEKFPDVVAKLDGLFR